MKCEHVCVVLMETRNVCEFRYILFFFGKDRIGDLFVFCVASVSIHRTNINDIEICIDMKMENTYTFKSFITIP